MFAILLLWIGRFRPRFHLFGYFQAILPIKFVLDFSGTWTRIAGVEGEHVDNLISTKKTLGTYLTLQNSLKLWQQSSVTDKMIPCDLKCHYQKNNLVSSECSTYLERNYLNPALNPPSDPPPNPVKSQDQCNKTLTVEKCYPRR